MKNTSSKALDVRQVSSGVFPNKVGYILTQKFNVLPIKIHTIIKS